MFPQTGHRHDQDIFTGITRRKKQGDKLLLFLENPVRVIVTAKTVFRCGTTELLNFRLCPGDENHGIKIRKDAKPGSNADILTSVLAPL
jgi:hypothetical protein